MMKLGFLSIVLAVFCLSCFAQIHPTTKQEKYTFKNGVSLNHWTGYPIDSFTYADSRWFDKEDVEWISQSGIDHIQLYVTGAEIITNDGKIIGDKINAIDSLINWCSGLGLGVILSPARMPTSPVDSTLPREERVKRSLNRTASHFGVFANYFKMYGESVRFLLNIGTDDKAIRNLFYELVIAEIRKTNPHRKLYVTAYSIDRVSELDIPQNDQNLAIAAELSQSAAPKAEAIDVFAWQHQEYFFTDKMPLITFPGTIPALDTSMVTDLGRWAIPFSNAEIKTNYFDKKFEIASRWVQQHHPKLELYISHFRYWTGYPFDPKTVEDEKSVKNFITFFTKAVKKHKVNWCMYDYNSGSAIRYPNGKKALILDLLKLRTPKIHVLTLSALDQVLRKQITRGTI